MRYWQTVFTANKIFSVSLNIAVTKESTTLFYIYIIIAGLVLGGIALMILVPILKRSGALPVWHDAKEPAAEKILVPAWRANMVWLGALSTGAFLALFSRALMRDFSGSWPFVVVSVCTLLAAIYVLYVAVRIFLRRHCLVQLVLNETSLKYKPVKWYAVMRFGRINALPVFLSDDWLETPYTNISGISIRNSMYGGNRMYLSIKGQPDKPLLIIANNEAEVAYLKSKIQERLPLDNAMAQGA